MNIDGWMDGYEITQGEGVLLSSELSRRKHPAPKPKNRKEGACFGWILQPEI